MELTLWEIELFITGILVGMILATGIISSVSIYFYKRGEKGN